MSTLDGDATMTMDANGVYHLHTFRTNSSSHTHTHTRLSGRSSRPNLLTNGAFNKMRHPTHTNNRANEGSGPSLFNQAYVALQEQSHDGPASAARPPPPSSQVSPHCHSHAPHPPHSQPSHLWTSERDGSFGFISRGNGGGNGTSNSTHAAKLKRHQQLQLTYHTNDSTTTTGGAKHSSPPSSHRSNLSVSFSPITSTSTLPPVPGALPPPLPPPPHIPWQAPPGFPSMVSVDFKPPNLMQWVKSIGRLQPKQSQQALITMEELKERYAQQYARLSQQQQHHLEQAHQYPTPEQFEAFYLAHHQSHADLAPHTCQHQIHSMAHPSHHSSVNDLHLSDDVTLGLTWAPDTNGTPAAVGIGAHSSATLASNVPAIMLLPNSSRSSLALSRSSSQSSHQFTPRPPPHRQQSDGLHHTPSTNSLSHQSSTTSLRHPSHIGRSISQLNLLSKVGSSKSLTASSSRASLAPNDVFVIRPNRRRSQQLHQQLHLQHQRHDEKESDTNESDRRTQPQSPSRPSAVADGETRKHTDAEQQLYADFVKRKSNELEEKEEIIIIKQANHKSSKPPQTNATDTSPTASAQAPSGTEPPADPFTSSAPTSGDAHSSSSSSHLASIRSFAWTSIVSWLTSPSNHVFADASEGLVIDPTSLEELVDQCGSVEGMMDKLRLLETKKMKLQTFQQLITILPTLTETTETTAASETATAETTLSSSASDSNPSSSTSALLVPTLAAMLASDSSAPLSAPTDVPEDGPTQPTATHDMPSSDTTTHVPHDIPLTSESESNANSSTDATESTQVATLSTAAKDDATEQKQDDLNESIPPVATVGESSPSSVPAITSADEQERIRDDASAHTVTETPTPTIAPAAVDYDEHATTAVVTANADVDACASVPTTVQEDVPVATDSVDSSANIAADNDTPTATVDTVFDAAVSNSTPATVADLTSDSSSNNPATNSDLAPVAVLPSIMATNESSADSFQSVRDFFAAGKNRSLFPQLADNWDDFLTRLNLTPSDLQAAVDASNSSITMLLAQLATFSQLGRSFDTWSDLVASLNEARRTASCVSEEIRQELLEYLAHEDVMLFSQLTSTDMHIDADELDHLLIAADGLSSTLHHLYTLDACGRKFQTFHELSRAVLEAKESGEYVTEEDRMALKSALLTSNLFATPLTNESIANLSQSDYNRFFMCSRQLGFAGLQQHFHQLQIAERTFHTVMDLLTALEGIVSSHTSATVSGDSYILEDSREKLVEFLSSDIGSALFELYDAVSDVEIELTSQDLDELIFAGQGLTNAIATMTQFNQEKRTFKEISQLIAALQAATPNQNNP